MREQPHFESDHERKRRMLIEDFRRFLIWITFWVIIFLGSLAALGFCKSKGEEISKALKGFDNEVEMHINHLMR